MGASQPRQPCRAAERPWPRPSPLALVQPLVRVGVIRLRTFSLGFSFLTQEAYFI